MKANFFKSFKASNAINFFLSSIITLVISLSSCSNYDFQKEPPAIQPDAKNQTISLRYSELEDVSAEDIGILHNEIVSYILNRLEGDGFTIFSLPVEDMNYIIESYAFDYLEEYGLVDQTGREELEELSHVTFEENMYTILSSEARTCLMEIEEIVASAEELSQAVNNLTLLKEEFTGMFPNETEEMLVMSAIEVAINSAMLWDETELNHWMAVFKDDEAPYIEDFAPIAGSSIVNSDIRGGWQAGLGYMWLNFGGPVGWGAFGGSILVGAVISSATDYFSKFIFKSLDVIDENYPFEIVETNSNYFSFLKTLYFQQPNHYYFLDDGKFAPYVYLFSEWDY